MDLKVISMANGLAAHAATRQSMIADNVANADTVGFRARDLKSFSALYEAAGGRAPSGEPAQPAFRPTASRAGHAGFDPATGGARAEARFADEVVNVARLGADSPNGNSVSLEDQMVRGAEAKAHHDMALGVLKKSIDLIRLGIGRR